MTIYSFNEAPNTKVAAITGAALLGGSGGTIDTIETNGNGQALSITPWTNNGLFKTGANRSDITLMTGYAGDITSFIAPVICCDASNEGYRAVLQNTSAGIFDRVQFSKDGTFLGVALFSTPLESANGAPRLDFRQSGADLLCDVYQGGSLYEALSYTDDTVEGPLTRTGTGILIAYQGSQLLLDSWNDNIAVVNIDPVLDTPISDISVGSDTSGVFASIAPNFSDANNDSLTYTVVPALPDGMELNSTTGEITGNGAITETAAADYVFYADDLQGGTPAQDTVSITVTAPVAVIDSTSAGPYYPGDTLLINHSNTSASGKLFAWGGISVSPTAEDANQSAIPIPNPLVAGFTTLTFGVDIDVTMDDAGEIATVQRQISVPEGYEIVTVASKNGFLAQAEFASIQVGHELYCPIVTDADWANGAIPMTDQIQNLQFYVRNTADATPEWGSVPFQISIPAATPPDTEKPVITLTGSGIVNLNQGGSYTEQGATWSDNLDGSGAATVGGDTVDVNSPGTYVITYDYTDTSGNAADRVTRTVIVSDVTLPVITLLGDAVVTHAHGTAYSDAGATASDNTDEDITSNIQLTGAVNVNAVGSYTLTYNVQDAAGNAAIAVTRTVNVTDQEAPSITPIGQTTINLALGQAYTEYGATASDSVDGNLTQFIQTSGAVDINTPGSYTITYSVSDAAGNSATATRTVVVAADVVPPVISLNGEASVRLLVGTPYTDAGATAQDNIDGIITANIITTGASFDTNVPGMYYVRYNVTDAAGNQAVEVVRSIEVYERTVDVPTVGRTISPTSFVVEAKKNATSEIREFGIYIRNSRNVTVSFEAVALEFATILETVDWQVEEGDSITIGAQDQSGDIAQADIISTTKAGRSLVRAIGSLENGEKISAYFVIEVIDPSL